MAWQGLARASEMQDMRGPSGKNHNTDGIYRRQRWHAKRVARDDAAKVSIGYKVEYLGF